MKLLRNIVIAMSVILVGCASNPANHKANAPVKQQKDVWERIRKEFAMPNLDNDPKVDYWVNFYASRARSVEIMAERSTRYIYYITKELEKRGLPSELALLPFVESAYNANALSRSKAAGLWQFIPSTGKHYNLAQDWWKDERQDTIHSTRAALDYLSYLYSFQDQDWHLALASYNWGEGAVRRARERNAAKGLGTDFLSLKMPDETRNYVPKLMAMKKIIANPAKYGVKLPHIPDQPYFVAIQKDRDIDVKTIIRLAGISEEEFSLLNPAPKRQVILAQHRPTILLPQKNIEQYKRNLRNHKGDLASWKGYTPSPGESLQDIADRHGISLEKLKSLNGYTSKQHVALSSRTLLIPKTGLSVEASPSGIDTRDIQNPMGATGALLASNQANLPVRMPSLSDVNPKQRLGGQSADIRTVAVQNDVIAEFMKQNNHQVPSTVNKPALANNSRPNNSNVQLVSSRASVTPTKAKPQATKAQVEKATAAKNTKKKGPIIHTVIKGDTLFSLAKRYGTTVDNIRALNNLGKRNIQKGQRLRMPGSGVQS